MNIERHPLSPSSTPSRIDLPPVQAVEGGAWTGVSITTVFRLSHRRPTSAWPQTLQCPPQQVWRRCCPAGRPVPSLDAAGRAAVAGHSLLSVRPLVVTYYRDRYSVSPPVGGQSRAASDHLLDLASDQHVVRVASAGSIGRAPARPSAVVRSV